MVGGNVGGNRQGLVRRWKVEVELTFDKKLDAEDAREALERIRPVLNRLLERECEILNHYHILIMPKICWEVD